MKKKLVYLVFIMILTISLFVLTGCSENNKTENSNSESNNATISSATTDNYTITNIIKSFNDFDTYITDGAIVQLNDNKENCYIINGEGKILYEITDPNIVNASNVEVSYMNGYVCYNNNQGTSYVLDLRTGDKVVEGSKTTECLDVTYDGYVLQKITNEEISGTTYQVRIVDKEGNVVWESGAEESSSINTITGNYAIFDSRCYEYNSVLINVKTGKATDLGVDGVLEGVKAKYNHIVINSSIIYDMNTDSIVLKFENKDKIENLLNENYFYTYSGIYNVNDGSLAKDLTDGNVENMYYTNNKYYVISANDFYYVLDDNFEYTYEPTKILATAYPEAKLTNYGVSYTGFENGETIQYYIPYDEFKADEDLSSIETKVPFKTFTGGSDGVRVCTDKNYIIAFNDNYNGRLVNPNALEDIKIHK